MRAELTSVFIVAIITSTCLASPGAQSTPQDQHLSAPDAQVVTTQTAMTEYPRLEVILKGDGTWQFEYQRFNYTRRNVLPTKTLIPKGYVGWITIHYGVKDAPPLKIEDGHIIIRIPPSGELKTSSFMGYDDYEISGRSGAYDYSRNELTPIKEEKTGGWIGPQPSPLSDEERTISASSSGFGDYGEESDRFFVGTKLQLRNYGHSQSLGSGSFEPLILDDGRYSDETSSASIPLTSEDTQSAFTKSGRKVILNTDAQNRRTWTYAEREPVTPDTSVLNVELSEAIKKAITLLEARRYEEFWRRFYNPYLKGEGYEYDRPKDKLIDGAQLWITFLGQEGFDNMLQGMGPMLLEWLRKIQYSQPVYGKIEYSKNIKALYYEDGDTNPNLTKKLSDAPFIRVGKTWHILFR